MTPDLALSVQQPWAWGLVSGVKPVENRTWATKYRGPLAIHASLKPDSNPAFDILRERCKALGLVFPPEEQLTLGAIIGSVTVVDCVRAEDLKLDEHKRWAVPLAWCWIVTDAVAFAAPTKMRGALGLWRVRQPFDRSMLTPACGITETGMISEKKR